MKINSTYILMACLVSCSVYGMKNKPTHKAKKSEIREKRQIIKTLLGANYLSRSKALDTLHIRCTSHVKWPEVERRIAGYLRQVDLFVSFSFHPALKLMKQRAARYDLLSYENLEMKQDLLCIDREAPSWIKVREFEQGLKGIAAGEVDRIKDNLIGLIRNLEFKPQEYPIDDRCSSTK